MLNWDALCDRPGGTNAQFLLSDNEVQKFLLRFSSRPQAADMQLVVVIAPVFYTPRITMQRWLDSTTTATPWAWSTSERTRTFLDLKSPGEHFHYSSDLGEANNSAAGDISDVHLTLLA